MCDAMVFYHKTIKMTPNKESLIYLALGFHKKKDEFSFSYQTFGLCIGMDNLFTNLFTVSILQVYHECKSINAIIGCLPSANSGL